MDAMDKGAKERATTDVALVEIGTSQDEGRKREEDPQPVMDANADHTTSEGSPLQFRLYRRRYTGVLGIIALNIVAGMSLTWFGPVANTSAYPCYESLSAFI